MAVRGWTLCPHAQKRRKEMRVTEQRIQDVIDAPMLDLPSWTYPERRMAFGKDLVIIYEPASRTIITVLWRSDEAYQDREAS